MRYLLLRCKHAVCRRYVFHTLFVNNSVCPPLQSETVQRTTVVETAFCFVSRTFSALQAAASTSSHHTFAGSVASQLGRTRVVLASTSLKAIVSSSIGKSFADCEFPASFDSHSSCPTPSACALAGAQHQQQRGKFIQTSNTPNPASLMFLPGAKVMEVYSRIRLTQFSDVPSCVQAFV